jgi:hypothetical protein
MLKQRLKTMLLPPFTVLIVKDSHRAVTVRITRGFAALLFVTFIILSAVVSFAISTWFPGIAGDRTIPLVEMTAQTPPYSVLPVDQGTMTITADSTALPSIIETTVSQGRDGEVTLSFAVANTDSELYIWLILNPDAVSVAETSIYPRSPLFRGLPVDYRNGVRHLPDAGKRLSFTFTGPEAGVDVKQFRVLAYTMTGKLLIDRTLAIQQNVRM